MRRAHEVSDEQNRFAPRILIQSCSAMVITVQSPTLVKFLQSHQWILCLGCPWNLSGSQDIILEWPSHRSSQCLHKYFKKIQGIWWAFSWSDTTLGKWFKDESYQECSELFETLWGEQSYASEMRASWGLLIFSDSKNMIQVDWFKSLEYPDQPASHEVSRSRF